MCMGLLFFLTGSRQVPFIHVIVFKHGHLSDIKFELNIMTLLEFMYILIPIHRQRRIQKGLKSGMKIISDKT
jgi:hypothetical protein